MTATTRKSPARRRNTHLITGVLALALSSTSWAATVSVLGLPHLANLTPQPTDVQREQLIKRLDQFHPSLICVEAMPGERVQEFAREPKRHGELLQTFALDAVRLASEQQIRLQIDAAQAREQAAQVDPAALDDKTRLRLVALQLASHDPWSAALNWSYLDTDFRKNADDRLGALAPQRLDRLLASANEITTLAIPLARSLGHHRLCAVDAFVDEVNVQALESGLMPILTGPGVMPHAQAWQSEVDAQWKADAKAGLLEFVRWQNDAAFADKDRAAQWSIFDVDSTGDAGRRRLMLWHARNAEIAAHLFRALAAADGQRVLLLIGAAHRPFIEAALQAQPWIETIPAGQYLAR